MESKKSKKQEKKSKNLEKMKQTLSIPKDSKKLLENMNKELTELKTTSENIKKELDNNIKLINLNFTDSNEETDRKKQNIKVKTYLLGQYQKLNKQFKQTLIHKYHKILSSSTEKMKTSNTDDSITANTQNILQEFTNALYPESNMHSFFFNSNEKNEKSDETLKTIYNIYDSPLVKNLVNLNSYIYEENNKIRSLTDLYTNISDIVGNNSNEDVKEILKKIDSAPKIEKKNEGATSETKKKTKKTSKKISDVLQENKKKLEEKKKQKKSNETKINNLANFNTITNLQNNIFLSFKNPKSIIDFLKVQLENPDENKGQKLEPDDNTTKLLMEIPEPKYMELLVENKIEELLQSSKATFKNFTPRVLDYLRTFTVTFLKNRPNWLCDIKDLTTTYPTYENALENLKNIVSMIRKNKWNTFDFRDFIIKYPTSINSIESLLKIMNDRDLFNFDKSIKKIESDVQKKFIDKCNKLKGKLNKLFDLDTKKLLNMAEEKFKMPPNKHKQLSEAPRYMIDSYEVFYNLSQVTQKLNEKIKKLHDDGTNFYSANNESEKNKKGQERKYCFDLQKQNLLYSEVSKVLETTDNIKSEVDSLINSFEKYKKLKKLI